MKPIRLQKTRKPYVRIMLATAIVASLLLSSLPLKVEAHDHANRPAVARQGIRADQATEACATATAIPTNGTAHRRALSQPVVMAQDWVKFEVHKNARYRLEVGDATGIQLELNDRCGATTPGLAVTDGHVEFTALRDGTLYLQVTRNPTARADVTDYQVAVSPAAPHRPSLTSLAEIPEAARRRAIDFLEELRGSDLAPDWKDARIGSLGRILYRPDIQEPAYYEFTVEKPFGQAYEPSGFIQLAAGEHDFPVTHWDVADMSPTQEMQEVAPLDGVILTEFFKLDAFSYASEYEQVRSIGISTVATDVVNIGDLPGRIQGLASIAAEPAELVTEAVNSDGTTEFDGPEELPLSNQEDWESWAALKAGYKTEYGPLLASLQESANDAWTLQNGVAQNGETLVKGDVRTVHGLPGQTVASISTTGAGATAQYLQQEQLANSGVPSGVKLTILDEPADPQARLEFQVVFQYTGGQTETVKYAIANSAILQVNKLYLPAIQTTGANRAINPAEAAAGEAAHGDWGPWSYWWADSNAGAIKYGQMSANSAPNNSSCASGCGGTSWAMLFAWVDQRAAEGHSTWANHWGLYRAGGGTGANAVAPYTQDAGVREMTWQIRNNIGTFCIFGSGATWPWNMVDAANYVRPRATAGWRLQTKYDPTGLCWFGACNGNRDLAKSAIQNGRKPAVVGTGWLKHYPLAYGYAERSRRSCFLFICSTDHSRWFYVNNGWSGSNNGWTSPDVWFAGTYSPN